MSTVRWSVPFSGRRLRVRRVDTDLGAFSIHTREKRCWLFTTRNGGSVANKYGYAAETEVLLAVSSPDGQIAAWGGRAPANKVTSRSAARYALTDVLLPGSHLGNPIDYFDERVGIERRNAGANTLKCLWYSVWGGFTTCVWCAVTDFVR